MVERVEMARPAQKAVPPEVPGPLWARLGHSQQRGGGTYASNSVTVSTAEPVILSPLPEDPTFTHRGVAQCTRCGAQVTVSKRRTPSKSSRLAAQRFWLAGFSGGLLLSVAGAVTFFAQMPGTTATPGVLTTAFSLSALFCLWAVAHIIGQATADQGIACDPPSMTLMPAPATDDECDHQARLGEEPCRHWVESPIRDGIVYQVDGEDYCTHAAGIVKART
ncbi:hypothetical protein [Actinomadura sp. 6N118]|uniref:hypothetical protein n=1 Tax=Actinomadura sp. 6N118 TaxID=3375151 RepID=UPI00378AD315